MNVSSVGLRPKRIGIVGGGIGGLTAAIALSRVDEFEVVVLERAPSPLAQGAALLLWTNAVNALASIGIDTSLRAVSAPIEVTEFRSAKGDLLCALPVGEWSNRLGAPSVVVQRPALIDMLVSELPPRALQTEAHFESYVRDEHQVTIRLVNGRAMHVDGLIGADGLRSAVRAQLLGPQSPRSLGQDAWVGVAHHRPRTMTQGITTATVGDGPRFWAAPLRGEAAFWYATLNTHGPNAVDSLGDLRRVFGTWHPQVNELIDSTAPKDVVRTQIFDRPPADRWGDGPITLLGDAAHPTTPDLGQGACQAIESAIVLASCLRGCDSISSGFREYERMRVRRTATIGNLCWLTSNNSTLSDPLLCRLRDAAIRFGFHSVARSHLEWILAGSSP